MTTREFMKSGVDPLPYQELLPIPYRESDYDHWNRRTKNDTPEFVAMKETMKAQLMAMKEGRNQMYFEFAIKLRNNGYSLDEINFELLEIARNDPKMRDKAKHIMRSLYKYVGMSCKPI